MKDQLLFVVNKDRSGAVVTIVLLRLMFQPDSVISRYRIIISIWPKSFQTQHQTQTAISAYPEIGQYYTQLKIWQTVLTTSQGINIIYDY